MLVISQKKGEKLRIGRDITITILESKAGKVRLGIEAPQDLEVMRESLYRERQKAKAPAEQPQAAPTTDKAEPKADPKQTPEAKPES